ncbi:MAG TPA: hypothetical protein VIK72_12025 [Clostridiaceae bacterium]
MNDRNLSQVFFDNKGAIKELELKMQDKTIPVSFRKDEHGGPRWYFRINEETTFVNLLLEDKVNGETSDNVKYSARMNDVIYSLEYSVNEAGLIVKASIYNDGKEIFAPEICGLKIGIDNYMESFPQWDSVYFPTLLRCEKGHFWGYCMSPAGKILVIGSKDPISSYSLDYNMLNEEHFGHRIFTFNLDFLTTLPLPDRHPQNLKGIASKDKKKWTIFISTVESLDEVKPKLSNICAAPMIEIDKYTLNKGEEANIIVYSKNSPKIKVTNLSGKMYEIDSVKKEGFKHYYKFSPKDNEGVYTINVTSDNGKEAEAKIYVRMPWSYYLIKARENAVKFPQKASTHMETWLGHFSNFLARKYFPDEILDNKAELNFRRILSLMYDTVKIEPIVDPSRIQNTAAMISLIVKLYKANNNIDDLKLASKLADWLIKSQGEDGAYRTLGSNVHYTCVTYIAKYIFELCIEEKKIFEEKSSIDDGAYWKQAYESHYNSVKAAIDDLNKNRDDIDTEGQLTFEDGMISCSSLQLGMFALQLENEEAREPYINSAEYLLSKHRCLEQLLVPDCRMNGCTLRFWEAQYDVLTRSNLINSPHGWTAWKIYATYYLYLLTGKYNYLLDTMNTLGACVQLLNIESGKLRWSFVVDPCIKAQVFVPDTENEDRGKYEEKIIGEQYIDMISDWWQAPEDRIVGGYVLMPKITRDGILPGDNQGACCDNDVHEIFKCLEEVALTSAYIFEKENGEIICFNCRIENKSSYMEIYPNEDVISSIHVNLKLKHNIIVHFSKEDIEIEAGIGMSWINA